MGTNFSLLAAQGGMQALESRVRQLEAMVRGFDATTSPSPLSPAFPITNTAAGETGASGRPTMFSKYVASAAMPSVGTASRAGAAAVAVPAFPINPAVPPNPVLPTQAQAWQPLIETLSQQQGVDKDLVNAVVAQESAFNPHAVSAAGAQGLMQLMPATARQLGVQQPLDGAENLEGGIRLLKSLLERYHGNIPLALAAYNAGPGAVQRHGGVPPYRETQHYVRRILSQFLQAKQQQQAASAQQPPAG
jgi:soluble lytic murein transglycosylase-like protein